MKQGVWQLEAAFEHFLRLEAAFLYKKGIKQVMLLFHI